LPEWFFEFLTHQAKPGAPQKIRKYHKAYEADVKGDVFSVYKSGWRDGPGILTLYL